MEMLREETTVARRPHAPPAQAGRRHDEEGAAQKHKPRKRPRRPRPSLLALLTGWMTVLMLLTALLLIIGLMGALFSERTMVGRIYPGIRVNGYDLGYHDSASARAALQEHYRSFLQNPVALVYGEHVWLPSAAELGIELDLDTAVDQAVALGHAETRVESARLFAAFWQQGHEIPLRLHVDQQAIQRYLLQVAQAVEQPPRNADVWLDGPRVVVVPAEMGRQVLVDETLQDVTVALQSLEQGEVRLRTRTLAPLVQNADVAEVAAAARTALGGPITLTSKQCRPACRWQWSPQQIAGWLRLNHAETPGTPPNAVLIDQEALRKQLEPMAASVYRNGTLPRLSWNNGQLSILWPGTSGSGLDTAGALDQINAVFDGGPRTIELPLADLPPPVIESDLASLGIIERVGVGVSSFRHSQPYRITNIKAGARRMHGVLIPPGETFSFNQTLGPVDGRNGFVLGAAIVRNRTQLEWGGGLCQVSTTMFRAAFWGGLPISERHEHTFRIEWYEELGEPPGLDATIFTGAADMRFENDTGNWLLIQSWVNEADQQLTIELYGTPTQREVLMSHQVLQQIPAPTQPLYLDDPTKPRGTVQQTDWARPGMKVEVYRTVKEGGNVIRHDTFFSFFEPWPNIYLRGTG